MLLFVKPLAKGHSWFESLDLMPSMLRPAEGCTPESFSLWQLPPRAVLSLCCMDSEQHSWLQEVVRKITVYNLNHRCLLKCGFSTSLNSWAPAFSCICLTQRRPARHELAPAGTGRAALCCVTAACGAGKPSAGAGEWLWTATAWTMPRLSGGPEAGSKSCSPEFGRRKNEASAFSSHHKDWKWGKRGTRSNTEAGRRKKREGRSW